MKNTFKYFGDGFIVAENTETGEIVGTIGYKMMNNDKELEFKALWYSFSISYF